MISQSRFANMAFAVLIFITGALSAYTRCIDKSASPLHDHAIDISEAFERAAKSDLLHCPDLKEPSAFGRRTVGTQKFSAVQEPAHVPEAVLNTNGRSTRENLVSPATFSYRLIPLYQFTVVYRI